MESYYLTLISNDSLDFYPLNRPTNFINVLDSPLKVPSNYECALVEISFVNSFSIQENQSRFDIFDFLAVEKPPEPKPKPNYDADLEETLPPVKRVEEGLEKEIVGGKRRKRSRDQDLHTLVKRRRVEGDVEIKQDLQKLKGRKRKNNEEEDLHRKNNEEEEDLHTLVKRRRVEGDVGTKDQHSEKPKVRKNNDVEKKYGEAYYVIFDQLDLCSPQEVVALLNKEIWENVPRLRIIKRKVFSYDENQNRIWMAFTNSFISIKLHKNILKLVGCLEPDWLPLKPTVVYLGKTKEINSFQYKGETLNFADKYKNSHWASKCEHRDFFTYAPDINKVDSILVYTNIIAPTQIGSSRANLLRFVDLPPSTKENKARESIDLGGNFFYRKVLFQSISQIQIVIRTIDAKPVQLSSFVRLTLHFRPRNSS